MRRDRYNRLEEGYMVRRFNRTGGTLTQLGVSTDPDDPAVDRSSLGWIMDDFQDGSGVLCLRYHDGRGRWVVSPEVLHDLDRACTSPCHRSSLLEGRGPGRISGTGASQLPPPRD